ncbi:MAG TPA: tetratricopeptide repeat protein [Gemmataceae bacterium]|nr:tetratricopeptide repeat protein [Gemmataceae bacterium]
MTTESKPAAGKRRRWAAAAAAVLVVALAAGGAAWWSRRPPPPPAPPEVDLTGVEPLVAADVREATAAVRAAPDSGVAWGRLGMLIAVCRYDAEAVACYRQAERCDPGDARWPYLAGVTLYSTDPAAAEPAFRQAAELCGGPNYAPRLRLAQTLLLLGRLDEAEQEFRRLLDPPPGPDPARVGLARTLLERGRPADALAELGPAADSPLTRKAAATLAAQVRRELGDVPGADRELARAAAIPDDPAPPDPYLEEVGSIDRTRAGYLNRIATLRRQGRQQEADALADESWRDYPDLGWLNDAKRHLGDGRLAEAESSARRAVEAAPQSFQAHQILGEVLFVRRDYAGATAAFREAVRLDPGNGSVHHALAHALLAGGELEGAIDSFRTAARYLPESAKAQRDLGDALARAGRTDEAAEHLRQAVRLDPADEEARRRLTEVERRRP